MRLINCANTKEPKANTTVVTNCSKDRDSKESALAMGTIRWAPIVMTIDKAMAPHTHGFRVTSFLKKDNLPSGILKTLNNCANTKV